MARAGVEPEAVPLRTKLAFGLGSGAEMMATHAVSLYALLFYNQVLGVPAHWVGMAIAASLVLDGVGEPLVGWLSDQTRSRWGRRHPWMFAAPIPIGLCFYAVFNPPQGLDATTLAIWCGVAVSLLRQAVTLFQTPLLAFGGELSTGHFERSRVMSFNIFFTWVGGASLVWIALTYFFPASEGFRNGLLNPAPWPAFAATFGVLIATAMGTSAWLTRDRIPFLPQPPAIREPIRIGVLLRDLGRAFRNRNYLVVIVALFFLTLMIGFRESLKLYIFAFYWELDSATIRTFLLSSFIGYLVSFSLATRLHRRFEKRGALVWACLIYALAPTIPIVLRMAGVLSPSTPGLVPILVGFYAVAYGAAALMQITVLSALADVVDENELAYGERQEGVMYSTRGLFGKIDQALGNLLAGFALTLVQFPEKTASEAVPAPILDQIGLLYGPVAVIPGVLAALCYARYRINSASYASTRDALRTRTPDAGPAPV